MPPEKRALNNWLNKIGGDDPYRHPPNFPPAYFFHHAAFFLYGPRFATGAS